LILGGNWKNGYYATYTRPGKLPVGNTPDDNGYEKVRHMVEVEERYNQIRNRRSALERVLKMAIVIEQLNTTLGGVLISGKVEGALPQQAARFYDQLTEYYRSLPSEVVQKLLGNLELGVSNNLQPILQITRIASGSDETLSLPGDEVDPAVFVNEFAENTKLLVGLRVLLYKRGVPTRKLHLELPRHTIESRLRQLEGQEKRYREHLREEISGLQVDLAVLMAHPASLTGSMREVLEQTHKDLISAREHLDGGGDLSEIPVLVESIELSSEPMNCEEFQSEIRNFGLQEAPQSPEVETKPSEREEPVEQELGFWETLKKWLSTPFGVSWSDIKSGKK
jgi:hypothetical protein